MSDALFLHPADVSHYRVRVLDEPRLTGRGVVHQGRRRSRLLSWRRVRRALAAEVGEPEGVRTIVFDFVVGLDESGCEVRRLAAEPLDDAMAVAREIEAALGPERTAPSIKSLATDGAPSRWYPDLDSLARANLAELDLA